MNIYLTGYRCSGKTSTGIALARMMGWPFWDTDDELVKSRGMSITDIVHTRGWDVFREFEKETLQFVASGDRQVVATGGGIVLFDENVQLMKLTGTIVWLRVRPETVAERMTADPVSLTQRPALTDQGALREIEALLSVRNPIYHSAMDFSIDTDMLETEAICQCILKAIRPFNRLSQEGL
jgi:shikimate kinase